MIHVGDCLTVMAKMPADGFDSIVTDPHCDHVVPLSRGGLSVMENLATACGPCNRSKNYRTPGEWKP